jgi:hypothetical protein
MYSEQFRYSGSTIMRGQQLSEIAKSHLSNRSVYYASSESNPKSSLLFLTKGVLKTMSAEGLESFKDRKNRLFFDPVDEAIPEHALRFADVVVAASKTAFDAYSKLYPSKKVVLINHHVDPRVRAMASKIKKTPKGLRTGYFGELVNTIITPAIEKEVDFILVDTSKQDDKWLDELSDYNFHYAIRYTRELDDYKPFLKGFTAAYCNANILIQESQKEAVAWLGEDYPFLLKEPLTEGDILSALENARDNYGKADWKRGLRVMDDIREKISDKVIGEELSRLFA